VEDGAGAIVSRAIPGEPRARSLCRRRLLAERRGDVVFLVDAADIAAQFGDLLVLLAADRLQAADAGGVLLGALVRAAERWLAGTREMSAEALIGLITSDIGHEILEALIDDLPLGRRAIFWNRVARMARRKVIDEKIRVLREEREKDQLDLLESRASILRRGER